MRRTEDKVLSRFMIYFNQSNLTDLRMISRNLNVAMIDLVDASFEGYIFKRASKDTFLPRTNKRYVGPRDGVVGNNRVRYVMRLPQETVERIRDIAFADGKRYTLICDDAMSEFIKYIKSNRALVKQDTPTAVKGRKSYRSTNEVKSLLEDYKKVVTW